MKTTKEIAIPNIEIKTIKTPDDMIKATEVLSNLNKLGKTLAVQKELLTKPLNQTLKEIRDRYREPETTISNKISEIRKAMSDYQSAQIVKQEKIAEKIINGDITLEKASKQLEKLPDTTSRISATSGTLKFKPLRKFKVVSLVQLPLEYHLANESLIRTFKGNLPGVEYWIEQIPINSIVK